MSVCTKPAIVVPPYVIDREEFKTYIPKVVSCPKEQERMYQIVDHTLVEKRHLVSPAEVVFARDKATAEVSHAVYQEGAYKLFVEATHAALAEAEVKTYFFKKINENPYFSN